MPLTLRPILRDAGIDPADAIAIRHAYVKYGADAGLAGIRADSTDEQILAYTSTYRRSTRVFPADLPRFWVVFIKEGGDQARLWAVVENRGLSATTDERRHYDISVTPHLADLRDRLVIEWKPARRWWMKAETTASYRVVQIADAEPIPFPGFDRLILDYSQLQAVMREQRYAAWRTALASVKGIYLITDTRDGRHYVGKADGEESLRQRWGTYAANGHGGNLELRHLDPSTFRYSILRVFDPAAITGELDAAESHFKEALDSRRHGLNAN